MKIIADSKIPFLQGVLEPFMDVEYFKGSEINRSIIKDADALIIRTRTKCNAELLEGTNVKYIATATIGFDHIDIAYCKDKGITWTNAPGCNSGSVMQYIAFALLYFANTKSIDLRDSVLGVIGVGNVGRKIVRLAEILEMQVLLNDPPKERIEGPCSYISLEGILRECNIITFHVPLTLQGADKTFHMVDQHFLGKLNPGSLLINSSRGEVIDSRLLLKSMEKGFPESLILDVWENEPGIDTALLNFAFYGTPHIAGYSADGKANGTKMSVQAISRFFGLGIDEWEPDCIPTPVNDKLIVDAGNKNIQQILTELIFQCYNFRDDDIRFRTNPEKFEWLRENYPLRREFKAFTVEASNLSADNELKLKQLGFKVL
jgi:erythronate-4-phosphate dehydrogenase